MLMKHPVLYHSYPKYADNIP